MARREELTADLFAHFGVEIGGRCALAKPLAVPLRALRAARPCAGCDWLRPEPRVGACPVCGAPAEPVRT